LDPASRARPIATSRVAIAMSIASSLASLSFVVLVATCPSGTPARAPAPAPARESAAAPEASAPPTPVTRALDCSVAQVGDACDVEGVECPPVANSRASVFCACERGEFRCADDVVPRCMANGLVDVRSCPDDMLVHDGQGCLEGIVCSGADERLGRVHHHALLCHDGVLVTDYCVDFR
jgi:hypothetical protein